jgi:hypothetical protein
VQEQATESEAPADQGEAEESQDAKRAILEAARARDLEERLGEAERLLREAPPEPEQEPAGESEAGAAEVAPVPAIPDLAAMVGAEMAPVEVTAAAELVAAEAATQEPTAPEAEGEARPRRRRRRAPAAEAEPAETGQPPEGEAATGAEPAAEEPEARPSRRRRRGAKPEEAAAAEIPGALLSAEEDERIRRAISLRDRSLELVAGLDQKGLADYEAIIDRLTLEHDLRSVTAALLRELAGREGEELPRLPAASARTAEENEQAASGEAMTRLFISIGRRARVTKESLQKLVRETTGIGEEDIGRVDLLHNFAFVEVRKAVASQVIETMHESMFKGREIQVERAKPVAKDGDEQAEVAGS